MDKDVEHKHINITMSIDPTLDDTIWHGIDHAINEAYTTAKDKGWWEKERNIGELVALIHSEATELLEAFRDNNPPSKKIPGFSSAEEEMADILIRVFDMAGGLELDLASAVIAKLVYNSTREHKHGRAF